MPDPLTSAGIISLLAISSLKFILSIAKRVKRSSCFTKNGGIDVEFTDNTQDESKQEKTKQESTTLHSTRKNKT
jgi:hypothetical protein